MPIRVLCPSCFEAHSVDASLQGKRIRCRECRAVLTVPAARGEGGEDDDRSPARRLTARRPAPSPDDAPRPARGRAAASGGVPVGLIVGGVLGSLLIVGMVIGAVYLLSANRKPDAVAANNPEPAPRRPAEDAPPPAALSAAKLTDLKEATVYLRVELPGGGVAEGTGFCVDEPGIVVTNAHVLGMLSPEAMPPRSVLAAINSGTPGERGCRGRVLAVDRDNDLAVLRLDVEAGHLPAPLRLGRAGQLTETQKVYIFGFPFGERLGRNITVTESSVSSLRLKNNRIERLQVNGGMSPGNSGGPVTDTRGDVVGVAVAIIPNSQVHFAIPAEYLLRLLAGVPGEVELGAPYEEGGKALLPARLSVLDPLGRVKAVKLEVFAGERGLHEMGVPEVGEPAVAFAGDGSRHSVAATGREGTYTAEAPVPQLKDGEVIVAQAVVVGADGVARYGPRRAAEYKPGSALKRQEVELRFKAPQRATRTLHMRSTAAMTVARGNDRARVSQKMDGYVLEELARDVRGLGTGVRLTLARPQFTREAGGRTLQAPAALSKYLSMYSPSFLVDARNEAKERGNRDFRAVPAAYREAVQDLFETVCNNWEMTTLPLPNRTVKPREDWPARVPMLVRVEDKLQVHFLHLTCTYEGVRTAGGRREAQLRLAGVVKSRDPRGDEALGRVSGQARVDVEGGFLRAVSVTISAEVDTGSPELRVLVTEESHIEREEGNTRGIRSASP